MQLIEQRPGRYLREPRLIARPGGVELHAIAWETEREAHVVFQLDREGAIIGERAVSEHREILSLGRDDEPRAITTPEAHLDESVSSGGWRAMIERHRGHARVVAIDPAGRATLIWEARAIAAAPAIAPSANGAWVAFHHDLREDTLEPDVCKWIAIRFVDREGRVLEPEAPMTDRDRDREGEEQGFELPSLAASADGSLAVFGRGSHSFFRQDLSAAGFGPRTRLGGSAEWGCRGRRVAVCAFGEGLLIARREQRGIVIERAAAPGGGAPSLRPAVVSIAARPRRGITARPTVDLAERWGRITLFGDIHQHSAHSDGCGTADEPYLRARWGYGDDFCALSDHESFLGKRIGPGEWAGLQAIAERHDAPGEFATLLAYEWTGKRYPGPGHKVVYLPRPGLPIASRDEVAEGRALLERLRALGAIAVPHHVGWTGADESAHDPELQPVWEICSCHGCYLHADHPLGARGDLRDQMIEAVLGRGHRFGFIACSDGHGLLFHHGVARKRDPFRTGLTAVQATSRTREAILQALRERRCYATSGVPIVLDLRAGSQPMGSVVSPRSAIVAEARGCSAIESIALIGPRALSGGSVPGPVGVIASASGRGLDARVEGELEGPWAYARVVQEDGEMAWSSPVFAQHV